MAASSSACYYDVFLSFRGEDTRNAFTDHLYVALIRRGFLTFRDDDEAAKGETLSSELEKAIHYSKSSILVLSKDYASSPWCLDELVMILDKKRDSEIVRPRDPKHRKHQVLPVFYDVKPSHLRDQKGTVAESFVRYENRIEEEADHEKKRDLVEKVKRWRSALREVANLIGLELQNHNSGNMPSLQVLNLSDNPFCELPNCVRSLTGLLGLTFIRCNGLQSLDFSGIQSEVNMVAIAQCSSLKKITFPHHVIIDNLQVFDCTELDEIEGYIKKSPCARFDTDTMAHFPDQFFMEFGILNYLVSRSTHDSFSLGFQKTQENGMVFVVPETHSTIQYLNLYCTFEYKIEDYVDVSEEAYDIDFIKEMCLVIKNLTKDQQWMYMPTIKLLRPFIGDWEWGSMWSFGNQMEVGDLILFCFSSLSEKVKVTESGYIVTFEGIGTSSTVQKSQHDYPEFRLSTGEYFLFQYHEGSRRNGLRLK